jgi:hypothetical protein
MILVVLKVGATVIVLDTLVEIAVVELFNALPLPVETKEVGSVSKVEYVVGLVLIAMTVDSEEELRLDEEESNKFEAACLPMLLLGDDDCSVPGDSVTCSAIVEFANGSN